MVSELEVGSGRDAGFKLGGPVAATLSANRWARAPSSPTTGFVGRIEGDDTLLTGKDVETRDVFGEVKGVCGGIGDSDTGDGEVNEGDEVV